MSASNLQSGAGSRSIPMPTEANGFTKAQLAAIRKTREQRVREGRQFVGDPDCLLCDKPVPAHRYERHVQECGGR